MNLMSKGNSLQEFIKGLTLAEYIEMFGTLWDQRNKNYMDFKLWPSQKSMCDKIERWQKEGSNETIHPKFG